MGTPPPCPAGPFPAQGARDPNLALDTAPFLVTISFPMIQRPSPLASKLLAPVAALLGSLSACTPTPSGPTVLWITVNGLPEVPKGATLARGDFGVVADLATALTARPQSPLPGEPHDVLIQPDVDTLPEVVSRYGLETAAYLTHDGLREEFGFLQGVLHSSDLPMLMAEAPDGPLRGAIASAFGYLEQKIPRPMEDGAFIWLHLDLELIPDPEARAEFLEATVQHFEQLLARRPDSTLIQVLFGPAEQPGSVRVRSPWSEGPTSELVPADLFGVVLEAMGHELNGKATVRVGEAREILLPETDTTQDAQ